MVRWRASVGDAHAWNPVSSLVSTSSQRSFTYALMEETRRSSISIRYCLSSASTPLSLRQHDAAGGGLGRRGARGADARDDGESREIEQAADDQRLHQPEIDGADERANRAQHARSGVERPRPADTGRVPLFQAFQAGGERHAHDEAQRRDQSHRQHHLKTPRQPDQRGKQRRHHNGEQRGEQRDQAQGFDQAAFIAAQQAGAHETADAARHQHREDHYGERVCRVAQEKHELLNQADLDQDVARADEHEVDKEATHAAMARQAGAQHQGRRHQDEQGGYQADGHQGEQQGHGLVDLAVGGLGAAFHEGPQIARLHGVEEERTVVGYGSDVEGVIALVGGGIGAEQQIAELIGQVAAGIVDGLLHAAGEDGAGARDIGGGERLARNQHGIERAEALGGTLTRDDDVPPRIFFADLAQGVDGQRDEAQGFARRIEAPAGDGEYAIAGEVQEVIAEGVAGVEVVFGEGESARGSGGPGIHQGGLQHLIFVGTAAHEAAAVLHLDVHLGAQIEAVAERGEALAHDGIGDDTVDLDGGDIGAAAIEGAGDVPTAAGSDDEGFGAGANGIGEGGALQGEVAAGVGCEVGEIEFRDVGGGVGVDDDAVAAIGVVDDADARKIVPPGEDLIGDGLPLGVADSEHGALVVVDQEGDQGESERHTAGASADRPGEAVPYGGGDGEGDGGGDHGVRATQDRKSTRLNSR